MQPDKLQGDVDSVVDLDRYYESNAQALKESFKKTKIAKQSKNIGKSAMIVRKRNADLFSDLGVSRRFERQNVKKNLE